MAQRDDDSSSADEHNARGIELADRGWLEEAEKEFRRAIELDPDCPHAYDNLGTVLVERGERFAALVNYVKAVEVDPNNSTARHYLASFLCTAGRELAISEFRRALELDPRLTDAHLNLGLALAEAGQHDDALAELESAHALAPDDHHVRHELACLLIDARRYPEAIGHLKQLQRNDPEALHVKIDLGVAYTAQGLFTEAEKVLGDVLDADPEEGLAHYHLAALYAHWQRRDEAIAHLSSALASGDSRMAWWLRDDAMFDTLRDDPAFCALLESDAQEVLAQHGRV